MRAKRGLLLAPGAGADRDAPSLLAIEAAVSPAITVLRMDFPYRRAGRKAPDRQPVLLQALRNEAANFAADTGMKPTRIVVGGRSMGGRLCSIAVAEGMKAAALVLVSYPLHPPGKPEKLRVEHFPDIGVPCLFVSGTRDAFGTRNELEKHTKKIAGDVTHVWVDGADHSMRKHDNEVADAVAAWLSALRLQK